MNLKNTQKNIKTSSPLLPADPWLILGFGLVASFGILMLYSASTVIAFRNFGNTSYYFLHQLLHGLLPGVILAWIASKIDYHYWEKLIPFLVLISFVLLALVKVPGLGFSAGGATRWVHLGVFTVQPAEIAKLTMLIYTAGWVSKKQMQLADFYLGLFPYLIVMGLFAGLILWQPDLGTLIVLVLSGVIMLFLSGVRLKYFLHFGIFGSALMALLIKLEPYRVARLITFLNPNHDPSGAGYQINQALIAIGAGGLLGYGYGLSRQKHNYLPEAIGDSIFAVTSEELGFVITSIFLLIYLLVILRAIFLCLKAPDLFGQVLGAGIAASLIIQAFINIGAIMAILPLTGVTLPLISYGSSSLIVSLVGVGIILNITRHRTS